MQKYNILLLAWKGGQNTVFAMRAENEGLIL